MAKYPDAGPAIRAARQKPVHKVDVLLVDPPSPDGAVWIRSQHRVGRRSRENMIWPQVSLAQLAAMVHPEFSVEIADAMAFGTHVTPMVRETLEPYPALDFVLRGEPEYTFKELVETLGRARGEGDPEPDLSQINGLGWRR